MNIYSHSVTTATDSAVVAVLHAWEYNGTWMGDRAITATVNSPSPIAWGIGDWCDYRGERFAIAVLPKVTRTSRDNTMGNALTYELTLIPQGQMLLQDVMMRDLVPQDNNLHYTGLTNFAFYADALEYISGSHGMEYSAGVRAFADRVGAVLSARYGVGYFSVDIAQYTFINGDQNISISNQSVWAALGSVCQSFDIAFDVRVTVENGAVVRRAVTFSPKTITARSSLYGMEWRYGKGNGLKSLECNVNTSQQVITRLYAVGSERNMPYRYYNYLWYHDETTEGVTERVFLERRIELGGKYLDKDGNELPITDADAFAVEWVDDTATTWVHWYRVINSGMYLTRLMLPSFRQAGNKMYIDSDNVAELGVKEGYKAFDTEDVHDKYAADIYPSVEGVTYGDVYNALSENERTYQRYCDKNTGGQYPQMDTRLDSVIAVRSDFNGWDGIVPEKEDASKWFVIDIPNLGFDPNDMLVDGDTPRISMKSGMCSGREFEILSCAKYDFKSAGCETRYYRLTLAAAQDQSIGQYFPNRNFPVVTGDLFVILGIGMPDIYVRSAEVRLQTVSDAYLADNDHTRFTYSPKIDNIFMANNPAIAGAIQEGKVMTLKDTSLGLNVERIITQLKISEGKADIPQYEVTVAEDQEPSLAQRVTEEVSTTLVTYGYGGGSGISDAKANQILSMINGLAEKYVSKTGSDIAQGILSVVNGIVTDSVFSTEYDKKNGFNISPNILTIYAPSPTTTDDLAFVKTQISISEVQQVSDRTMRATSVLVCTTTGYAAFAGLLELGASGASRFYIRSRKIVIEDTDQTAPEAIQRLDLGTGTETEISARAEVTAGKTYNVSHEITYDKYGSLSAGFELGVAGMVFVTEGSRSEISDTLVTVYSTESESVNGIRLNAVTQTVQVRQGGEWRDY